LQSEKSELNWISIGRIHLVKAIKFLIKTVPRRILIRHCRYY